MRLETTRKSDLAARAMITLAPASELVKTAELAAELSASAPYRAHVMGPLVAQGWVESDPGRNGGYRLIVGLTDVSVLELTEAVEGPTETGRCVVGDRPCLDTGSCALHDAWIRARRVLTDQLAVTSIADIAHMYPESSPDSRQ